MVLRRKRRPLWIRKAEVLLNDVAEERRREQAEQEEKDVQLRTKITLQKRKKGLSN